MLLDSKDEPGGYPNIRQNMLIVRELSRADLHATFDCQASNNNISQPVSTSVAIDMYRKYTSYYVAYNYLIYCTDIWRVLNAV